MRPTRRQLLWTLTAIPFVTGPLLYAALRPAHLRNFGVVREGVLYRSGQLTPSAFDRVLTEHGIKTVVSFRPIRDEEAKSDAWEEVVCRERGLRHVRTTCGEEAGEAGLNRMAEGFLAVMDDPRNYPVLVHCLAGRDRTGAMCAIYRMEYDRWSPERAATEMRAYEFDPDKDLPAKAYERYVLQYRTRAQHPEMDRK